MKRYNFVNFIYGKGYNYNLESNEKEEYDNVTDELGEFTNSSFVTILEKDYEFKESYNNNIVTYYSSIFYISL